MDPDHRTFPLAKLIIPALSGLALSYFFEVPIIILSAGVAVSALMVILLRGSEYVSGLYLWMFTVIFFFAAGNFARPEPAIPQGEKLIVVGKLKEKPYRRGRWMNSSVEVGYYRIMSGEDNAWVRVSETVQIAVDTVYNIAAGDCLAFIGWVNPVDRDGGSYGRLMRARGFHSRIYITPGNLIRTTSAGGNNIFNIASDIHEKVVGRLSELDIPADRLAIVTAMTAGDKTLIDRELRGNYSAVGAAHLLAVSGLHVGIVFILINLTVWFLPVFRGGHIVKNIVAVALIWLYAVAAGLSPSVIRAAMMFSFVQLALAYAARRNSVNILCGSAIVMLAINPNYAVDPSFVLSYVSVLALIVLFDPVYRMCRTPHKFLNAVLSVTVIGVLASAATAPLVSYWFGNIPIAGIIINPLVMITAHVIVMSGILWIIIPLDALGPVFSWILSVAAGAQNALVEWSANLGFASVGFSMPLWGVVLTYVIYLAVAAIILTARKKKN